MLRLLSISLHASMPSSCGMLVYRDDTSRVTRRTFGGKLEIPCIFEKEICCIPDVGWYCFG